MSETILGTVTSTDQVRSLLGITERDLGDDKFDPVQVELELSVYLAEKSIDYVAITAAGEAGSPSATETTQYNYLKLLCMYYAAVLLVPRLRLAAVQKVGDGDNTMERFLNPKFETTEETYKSKVATYLTALTDEVSDTTTQTDVPSLFSGVAPAYDPVTGG